MYNQRFILQLYNLDVSQIQWVYTWKHLYGERIDKKGCISSWATELSCLLHVNVETLCTLFGLIFFLSYLWLYFLFTNNITSTYTSNMERTLQPIQNMIWSCDLRLEQLVDSIRIGFMVSLWLWHLIWGQTVVS